MQKELTNIIRQIPKSDLHVHLDGSVRVETLIELSKKQNLSLPSYTTEGLNELVFKDQYDNLVEYLKGFGLILPIMQNPENLEQISYEFAKDSIEDGVLYVEPRFAPHFHINENQDIDQVLLSIDRGLNKAKLEYNKNKPEDMPEFNYGIIACAMRFFKQGYSKYLDIFLEKHKNLKPNEIFSLSSFELAKSCVNIRDKYNIPIVGLDIAGAEAGNPPGHHKKAYDFARENSIHLTAHAGEAYGPESIYQAITELEAERIGHGYYLFSKDEIKDPDIKDKDEYLKNLLKLVTTRQTTFEVCLTSNFQTMSSLKNIKDHSFTKMLENNLSTVICTDNRTVSKTNLTKELTLAVENFNLDKESLKKLILNSFEKSFFPRNKKEKSDYIKKLQQHIKIQSTPIQMPNL